MDLLGVVILVLFPTSAPVQRPLDEVPRDLSSLQAAADEAIHRVVPDRESRTWAAHSPAQGMHATFSSDGIRIVGGNGSSRIWNLRLWLEAWGREGSMQTSTDTPLPVAEGHRVEYHRGSVIEWYANGRRGLEQGFTISTAPEGGEGPLLLALSIGGDLLPEVRPGGRDVSFTDTAGAVALHYAGLRAWDSAGRDLEASLFLEDHWLSLRVEDAEAEYPVFIDPWISTEEAKLTAGDAEDADQLGYSVALSGDTAVVGVPYDDHVGGFNAGSAYVFVRNGTSWSEQQKLTASDAVYADYFGWSVALSGDTAVIGAFLDDHSGSTDAGSAYVFVHDGTTWSEQQKLTAPASDAEGYEYFGFSVALSGDTTVIGAPNDSHAGGSLAGSAYVFRVAPWFSYCTAGVSAGGCQATLSAFGNASASSISGFHLMADNVEGGKDGLLFFGTNGRQANPWGNSTGLQASCRRSCVPDSWSESAARERAMAPSPRI